MVPQLLQHLKRLKGAYEGHQVRSVIDIPTPTHAYKGFTVRTLHLHESYK